MIKTQQLLLHKAAMVGLLLASIPAGQNASTRSASVPIQRISPPGNAAVSGSVADSLAVPPSRWPGERFIFLEKTTMFREYGYEVYTSPLLEKEIAPCNPAIETRQHRLGYLPFVGKIMTVSAAKKLHTGEYLISFVVDSSGLAAFARTRKGTVEGLALFSDRENAEKRWLGKTVYSRRKAVDIYDTLATTFSSVPVSILEPLQVVGVRWGIPPLPPQPIMLVVRRQDGTKGLIPVHYRWTNVLPEKRVPGMPWEKEILESDPRKVFAWDEYTWKSIDKRSIFAGMSAEQVRLSWGEPKEIRPDSKTGTCAWRYETNILTFKNDTLLTSE
jgi:hypothetical protein